MRAVPGILVVLSALALDQAIKVWVEASLPLHFPVEVLPFFSLFRTYNTGIAFSFLSDLGDTPLVLLTTAISGFIIWLWTRTSQQQWISRLGFAFVIGGAAGNLVDRIRLGHVVDYVLLHAGQWSFAVFNLADSFITVGAGLVLIDELMQIRRERRNEAG